MNCYAQGESRNFLCRGPSPLNFLHFLFILTIFRLDQINLYGLIWITLRATDRVAQGLDLLLAMQSWNSSFHVLLVMLDYPQQFPPYHPLKPISSPPSKRFHPSKYEHP